MSDDQNKNKMVSVDLFLFNTNNRTQKPPNITPHVHAVNKYF